MPAWDRAFERDGLRLSRACSLRHVHAEDVEVDGSGHNDAERARVGRVGGDFADVMACRGLGVEEVRGVGERTVTEDGVSDGEQEQKQAEDSTRTIKNRSGAIARMPAGIHTRFDTWFDAVTER